MEAAYTFSGFGASVVDGVSTIGGGSAAGSQLPTRLVAITYPEWSADDLETRLRGAPTPVIARIDEDRVVLDLRTVRPGDDALLGDLVVNVAGGRANDSTS